MQGSLCGCVWKKQNTHFHLCIWVHLYYTRTWDFSTKTGRQGLFFHHTFKSELLLQARGFVSMRAACSWLHTFISQEPKCTGKYAHFSTNITRECTLVVVHIYLSIYQYYCWEVGRRNAEARKSITRKGKNFVTQFSKLYEAWHSMLRKTPRYSGPYLKYVQTICTSWVCKAELEIGQDRLFWYCLFLASADSGW